MKTQRLIDARWLLHSDTFAEKISRGKWKRYSWVVKIMRFCEEKILAGNASIIIMAPPQHGKSEAISHWLNAWYLTNFPDQRIIEISYSDARAAVWGTKVKLDFDENPFLGVKFQPAGERMVEWRTIQGGGMRSAGVGGSITSLGANLIVFDDPHKDWAEGNSSTELRHALEFVTATAYTRLQPNASFLNIQTRWNVMDVAGYLMADHSDIWSVLRLPAIAEEDDPLGRQPGEALCPERFDVPALMKIKAAMKSSAMWEGLYQQRPVAVGGNIIKRDWFKRYVDLPEEAGNALMSFDLTFKKEGTSTVAAQRWYKKGANFYVSPRRRQKLSFTETKQMIREMKRKNPLITINLMEKAANGEAILDELKNEISGMVGVPPRGSKTERLVSVSGFYGGGNVFLG